LTQENQLLNEAYCTHLPHQSTHAHRTHLCHAQALYYTLKKLANNMNKKYTT